MCALRKSNSVRPKKSLGQHFLHDQNTAQRIVTALRVSDHGNVLEIGPGMGVLTQYLLQRDIKLKVIELDRESVAYLKKNFPLLEGNIIEADFLQYPITDLFEGSF